MSNLHNLKQLRKQYFTLLDKLPESEVKKQRFGRWGVFELVGHLNGWHQKRIEELALAFRSQPVDLVENYDDFNDQSIKMRVSYSWQELLVEFHALFDEMVEKYESFHENQLNQPAWMQSNRTIAECISIEEEHLEGHLEDILSAHLHETA